MTASSTVTTNADGKASAQVTVKNSGAQTVVVKDSAQTGAKAVDQVTFAVNNCKKDLLIYLNTYR